MVNILLFHIYLLSLKDHIVVLVVAICVMLNYVECMCVIQLTVLMDSMCVPVHLRPYLPLYLELITESPVLRDGGKFEIILAFVLRTHYSILPYRFNK